MRPTPLRPTASLALVSLAFVAGACASQAWALSPTPVYIMADATALPGQAEIARNQNRLMLGTFHDRLGDQAVQGSGFGASVWARGFGEDMREDWSGRFSPRYQGDTLGGQTGIDLLAQDWGNGHRDRLGLFAGYADTHGAVDDTHGRHARTTLDNVSLGGYWSHMGPGDWYVDAVFAGSSGRATVSTDVGHASTDVATFAGSLEAGYPIALGRRFTLEPEVQILAQYVDIDPILTPGGYLYASCDSRTAISGRLGLRLQGTFDAVGVTLKPYAVANLWQAFSGTDHTILLGQDIPHRLDTTSLEMRLGMNVQISQRVGVYADAGYETSLNGLSAEAVRGTVGARFSW